jgi:hypothetical protein
LHPCRVSPWPSLSRANSRAADTKARRGGSSADGLWDVLLNGQPLDRVTLQQITDLGDCHGEEQPELRNVFFLAAVPPAPYQQRPHATDWPAGA